MNTFHGMDYKPARPRNTRKVDKKPSRTPGKAKAETCQTDPTKKFFASSSKAHKDPNYPEWHEKFKRLNMNKMTSK